MRTQNEEVKRERERLRERNGIWVHLSACSAVQCSGHAFRKEKRGLDLSFVHKIHALLLYCTSSSPSTAKAR